ncbi:TetR/AcrR family transcriptional regulator [Actinomadura sp. SCN-SB]|uniref:TetR/AcrR family transcriptional regulator n=1 Tax=Actinomadura sp. SCN-SB TaxID=3373092 RepID=UPI00375130C3
MRADARRNHERLVAEARAAFAEHGTEASLEDIARRAGVGIGTLYRHFPSRDALLEALLRERFDTLAAQAREAPATRDALLSWTRTLTESSTAYRGLVTAFLTTLRDESSALYASCKAMNAAASDLLARTQKAGEIRPDLEPSEFLTLTYGIAWADEQVAAPPRRDRLLALLFDGLRPS